MIKFCIFQKIFIERNIGDHAEVSDSSLSGSELLRSIAQRKRENLSKPNQGDGDHNLNTNASIRQVFSHQNQAKFEAFAVNECDEENTEEEENTGDESKLNNEKNFMTFMEAEKQEIVQMEADNLPINFDPRNLFCNSPECVPQNSDQETDN